MASLFFADGSVPPAGFIQLISEYNTKSGWDPIQSYLDDRAGGTDPIYQTPDTDTTTVNGLIDQKIATLLSDVSALKSANNSVQVAADITRLKTDVTTLQTGLQDAIYSNTMGLYGKADASRVDTLETTLVNANAMAEGAISRLNALDAAWDPLVGRVGALETENETQDTSATALQTRVQNLELNGIEDNTRYATQRDQINALSLDAAALRTIQNRHELEITQNTATITASNNTQSGINSTMQTDINNLKTAKSVFEFDIGNLQTANTAFNTRLTTDETLLNTLKAVADDVQLRMYYNDFRRIAYVSVGDVGGSGNSTTNLTVTGYVTSATKQVGSGTQSVITINWSNPGYQLVPVITAFNDYNSDPNNSANNDMSGIFLHKQSLTATQARFIMEKNGTNFSVNVALYIAFFKFQ